VPAGELSVGTLALPSVECVMSVFDSRGRTAQAHALSYAARGWRVLPIVAGGKAPAVEHGVHEATTDPNVIRAWFHTGSLNVGIAPHDDLFILDVDPRHGGDLSLAALEAIHGALPATVEARTGGGGRHLFLRGRVSSRTGVRPGLDVKAEGGYVVAAPSTHASGQGYSWLADRAPDEIAVGPAPGWLMDVVTREVPARDEVDETGIDSVPLAERQARARRFLKGASPAVSGERGHDRTFAVSCAVTRGFDLSADEAMEVMEEWNDTCSPPWSHKDLFRKLKDGRRKGTEPLGGRLRGRGQLDHLGLSDDERSVVEVLVSAHKAKAHISIRRIAQYAGLTRMTVHRILDELERRGLIKILRGTPGRKGEGKANGYDLAGVGIQQNRSTSDGIESVPSEDVSPLSAQATASGRTARLGSGQARPTIHSLTTPALPTDRQMVPGRYDRVYMSELKRDGWTPKLVQQYLGPGIQVPNPFGYDRPCRVWSRSAVDLVWGLRPDLRATLAASLERRRRRTSGRTASGRCMGRGTSPIRSASVARKDTQALENADRMLLFFEATKKMDKETANRLWSEEVIQLCTLDVPRADYLAALTRLTARTELSPADQPDEIWVEVPCTTPAGQASAPAPAAVEIGVIAVESVPIGSDGGPQDIRSMSYEELCAQLRLSLEDVGKPEESAPEGPEPRVLADLAAIRTALDRNAAYRSLIDMGGSVSDELVESTNARMTTRDGQPPTADEVAVAVVVEADRKLRESISDAEYGRLRAERERRQRIAWDLLEREHSAERSRARVATILAEAEAENAA
jgi:hypothetical protein